VTNRLFETGNGHTELSEEDRLGLIPTHLATRGQLFAAEQINIATALLRRHPTVEQLLDDRYLRELHRAMFGEVWEWAGRYRLVGADPDGSPQFGRRHQGVGRARHVRDRRNRGPVPSPHRCYPCISQRQRPTWPGSCGLPRLCTRRRHLYLGRASLRDDRRHAEFVSSRTATRRSGRHHRPHRLRPILTQTALFHDSSPVLVTFDVDYCPPASQERGGGLCVSGAVYVWHNLADEREGTSHGNRYPGMA